MAALGGSDAEFGRAMTTELVAFFLLYMAALYFFDCFRYDAASPSHILANIHRALQVFSVKKWILPRTIDKFLTREQMPKQL